MATSRAHAQRGSDHEASGKRSEGSVTGPGETELGAWMEGARGDPERAARAFPRLGSSGRACAAMALQQTYGNAFVQRLVARLHDSPSAAGQLAVQRYTVPANLACPDVVPWLNRNSPYAPEWAETRSTYTFNGQARVTTTTLPDGTIQKEAKGHRGLSVSVSSPIDRPSWSPSARPNQAAEVAAWNSMRATLDAHEQQHRQIAQTWRGTLDTNWKGVDVTATGTSDQDARTNLVSALQATQQGWQAQAQAAQSAIDPFRGAVLSCPAAPTPGGSGSGSGPGGSGSSGSSGSGASTDTGADSGGGSG